MKSRTSDLIRLRVPGTVRYRTITFIVFVVMAVICTCINYPLARFPWQDLIWNDLALLGRIAWSSAALKTNPLASVDFLQGLGSNVRDDVKIIAHFYDPASVFALFTNAYTALVLRTFFLVLYCLLCLNYLLKQQRTDMGSVSEVNTMQFPVLVFYILSPQLLFEVSHHFSAVFYALPGVILGLRWFLKERSLISALGFLFASTLFVQLSDLHIIFLAPALGVFLMLYDPIVRNAKPGSKIMAALSFCLLILLSFLNCLKIFSSDEDYVVASSVALPIVPYVYSFIVNAVETMILPMFTGPVSLYIAPYLPVFALIFIFRRSSGVLFSRMGTLGLLFLSLFLLGILLHGIGIFRDHLPSSMRYHLTIIPFITNIWIIYHFRDIMKLVNMIKERRNTLVIFCLTSACVFIVLSFIHMGKLPETASFVFGKFNISPSFPVWKNTGRLFLAVYPMLFILLLLFGKTVNFVKAKGAVFFLILFLASAVFFYGIRTFGLRWNDFVYADYPLFRSLYVEPPAAIDRIIKDSPYASAPRSFVPVAVCLSGSNPERGQNDKLLPLIEYPESFGGRSFFQWRYSYTRQTSELYNEVTHQGPVCYFPPVPANISYAIELAVLTESPFIICADSALINERLDLLGSHRITNQFISDNPGRYNDGLVGTIYVYGVKVLVPGSGLSSFERIDFSRTEVRFSGLKSSDPLLKLPISYFSDLRAYNESGARVSVQGGSDGFAYVNNNGEFKDLLLTSFSWASLASLLAPLAGFFPLTLVLLRRKGRKNMTDLDVMK